MKAIVPFDFSAGSRSAVKFGLYLSRQIEGLELEFMYCSPLVHAPRYVFSGVKIPSLQEQKNKILSEMKQFVSRSQTEPRELPPGISFHFEDTSHAAQAILEAAKKGKADVIIMGTTGESNIRRILMGSTTLKVLEEAPCPVLTVPLKHKLRALKTVALATELVNTDKEVAFIHHLLAPLQAHYHIVHVYPVFPQKVVPSAEVVSRLTSKIEKNVDPSAFTFHIVKTKEDNQLIEGLEKELSRLKPALLVMFHRHRNWLDKLISRSETESVAFHTKIPVLSVRTDLLKRGS